MIFWIRRGEFLKALGDLTTPERGGWLCSKELDENEAILLNDLGNKILSREDAMKYTCYRTHEDGEKDTVILSVPEDMT